MNIGIIALIVVIIAFIILKNIISLGLKLVCLAIIAVLLGATIWISTQQPQMHKPFSVDTIEYLFKINKDGSMTTTKQVITQTLIKDNK